MKIITTKWVDTNKGDSDNPNCRARLVGRELAFKKRTDLFAATPPLEALRMMVSLVACRQGSRNPKDRFILMTNDVKRAYFYAPATRPIYITIPEEDWEEGDEGMVGKLNLSLYGTRDAAMNWAKTYTDYMKSLGFVVGRSNPCNFHHPQREISCTVHGDDFTSAGREEDLKWLDRQLQKKFEIKTEFLGPNEEHMKEVRVLNRVLRWEPDGIQYEPDQRHAEQVLETLEMVDCKGVTTPGSRDDVARASRANEVEYEQQTATTSAEQVGPHLTATTSGTDLHSLGNSSSDQSALPPSEATKYRGVSARLNYLCQDRVDISYACKEAARKMSSPKTGDWHLLRRIARYLRAVPRLCQTFTWQDMPKRVDGYVDSDWAGCKTTCRSTSGGALMLGQHCIKGYSTTQATVALSSGEAELYAMTKGASQALGIISLAADFGIVLSGMIHCDAAAALGIVNRQGLGKLRHVNVRYLWLQEKVKDKELEVVKVPGADNPADLFTKHLDAATMWKHVTKLGFHAAEGRAGTAPKLATRQQSLGMLHNSTAGVVAGCGLLRRRWRAQPELGDNRLGVRPGFTGLGESPNVDLERGPLAPSPQGLGPCGREEQTTPERRPMATTSAGPEGVGWIEVTHEKPRRKLVTPLRIEGVPPIRALSALRVTEGVMLQSGRQFRRIDSWTCRSTAHEELAEPWTGTTWFVQKSSTASEPSDASQKSFRAPACYGERPLRGSEQRSVLRIDEVADAAASEKPIQLGPTPTRGTGPEVHERLGVLNARHLPRERVRVNEYAPVVVEGVKVSEKRVHVMRHALQESYNSVFAGNHTAYVCRPIRPEACEEPRAPRFVGGFGPRAYTIHKRSSSGSGRCDSYVQMHDRRMTDAVKDAIRRCHRLLSKSRSGL